MKEPIFYRIVRPIITFLFKVLYRPTIIGVENIPKGDSVVLAGNHTNNFDSIFLISSTKRTIHFLAKNSLVKGIKKIIFKNMGIIPVNREQKNPQVINNALKILNDNKVIGVFPEGTINRTNDITLPFKFGAVKLSSDSNATLVPFVISGDYKIFRKSVQIEFFEGYKVGKNLEQENSKLQEKISNEIQKKQEEKK